MYNNHLISACVVPKHTQIGRAHNAPAMEKISGLRFTGIQDLFISNSSALHIAKIAHKIVEKQTKVLCWASCTVFYIQSSRHRSIPRRQELFCRPEVRAL